MTNTMKITLRSVAALSIIAVVCVALLAVANAFIPKYKPTLDAATAALINKVSPTGVGDAEAFSGGYFEMKQFDDKQLADFNKQNGAETNNKVLAVYNIVKGPNAGTVAVEAQAQGYAGNDPIIMMTSFDKSALIMSTAVKSQNENSPGDKGIFQTEYFDALVKYVNGKKTLSPGEVETATGATSGYSINGVVNALNISRAMAASLGGETEQLFVSDVDDLALIHKLNATSMPGSTSFRSYTVSKAYSAGVAAIYKGDKGDYLVVGKGIGWGAMEILFAFRGDAIGAALILKNNEKVEGTPSADKYVFNDESVRAALIGKRLNDLGSMTTDELLASTGATVVKTAGGIRACAEGALSFLPHAREYTTQIEESANG